MKEAKRLRTNFWQEKLIGSQCGKSSKNGFAAEPVYHQQPEKVPDVMENMMLAAEHSTDVIQPKIAHDPRFAGIKFFTITADEGALLVGGKVNSSADLDALRKIVDTTSPPLPVQYGLVIVGSN